MEWYLYIAVIAAGFAAGFINTLAGSGSLITLPLLIFLGLPAGVANGTNRVAILLQNIVGVGSFHQQKAFEFREGIFLAVPAVIGAIIGARIAIDLDEHILRTTIGVLMVLMLIVLLVQPKRWLIGRTESADIHPGWVNVLIFFFIGVYGGFIQAGVGVFLLAGLVLGAGFDLVKANAIKVFIVLCFTVFALVIFVAGNQVYWSVGFILAIGNMSGAWIASRMAIKRGAGFIRWILIGVVLIAALKLLGVLEFFFSQI